MTEWLITQGGWWIVAIVAVPVAAGLLMLLAPGAPPLPEREDPMLDDDTGCPACGSDDYIPLEQVPGAGEPDYAGPKQCQACGEVWQ